MQTTYASTPQPLVSQDIEIGRSIIPARILYANMMTHSLDPLHRYPSSHIHISCYHQLMHTPVNMRAICRSEEVKDSSLYLVADHTILVNRVVDIGE